MIMRLPDFLIVGVRKAGTTALYHALRRHPGIIMSSVKEPRFFAFEGERPNFEGPRDGVEDVQLVTDLEAYAKLFEMAPAGQMAGEASPIYTSWYRTEQTALNIQRHLPNVKLIVVLRHPALRAWLDYNYQRQLGDERCLTLREALDAEPQRANWFPDFSYFKTGDLQLFIFFTHTTNPSLISRQRHAGEGEVDDHLVRHSL